MTQQQQRPSAPQYENRSRLGLATPAIRPGMKGRLLLAGPSGSGKTYTSLLIAMTLRENIDVASVLMLDTEKDSGRTYADEFLLEDGTPAYHHVSWAAPYNAVDLAMTLRDASGKYDVVIVDSHSHFWRGTGGVLDVAGGRWTGWSEARPMHADMIDAILSCDCHVILCARMKQEHAQETNERGKVEVRKLGMKIQQDDDLEYEVNVALEMDMAHTLRVTKSRTRAVPVGKEYIAGHAEEFGGQYRDWLRGGEPAASKEQIDNLVDVLNRIPDNANRMRAKQQFVQVFGRPEMLLVSRLHEAAEWVANAVLGNEPPPDRGSDEVPPDTAESAAQPPAAAPANGAAKPAGTATDTAEPPHADSVQAGAMGEQTVFNGDTGHCAACGAPVWYRLDDDSPTTGPDMRGQWLHANESDDDPTMPHDVTPCGPDDDHDAVLVAWAEKRASVARTRIEAEVGAMTPVKLAEALTAAHESVNGGPKALRARLVAVRLAALAETA